MLRLLLPSLLLVKAWCSRLLRQRIPCAVFLAVTLLFTLHLAGSRRLPTPEWVKERGEGECSPRHNIAFLKSHKCASSAIQNILFRYGLTHKLHFALPAVGNYFGGGLRPFNADMLKTSPWGSLGVNIMAVHMKWDHQEVRKVMPNDTLYITIVREPMDLFESLYIYTKMNKKYNKTVEEFALSVPTDAPRHNGYLGYNQMVWDFGIQEEDQVYNLTAVNHLVREAEEHFDLVMVAERMEESLVLLSHLLCWDLRDVIVLKLNARSSKFKKSLSSKVQEVLREKLSPDYLLYKTFSKRLDELVEDFGRERMGREVARLRTLTEQLMETCEFTKRASVLMTGADRPWSDMVEGYKAGAGSSKCRHFSRSELSFINFLRGMQRAEVSRRFGTPNNPGLDALPLGAHIFEDAASMNERINSLKKMLVHTDNTAKESSVFENYTKSTVEKA